MKAETKKRFTSFVNALFSVVLVVGLMPTWALSSPTPAYAAGEATITTTVDDLTDVTLPTLSAGVDFTLGQPVHADPTTYTDASGNMPVADLAEKKAAQGLSLEWIDADTGKEFDWNETPVTHSVTVEGTWVATQCTVTVSLNDENKTPADTVTVPWGQSYASVKGGAPATPSRDGWRFDGWYTPDGSKYDFNSKVTQNTIVEAKWSVEDVKIVPTTDPTADIKQSISGTVWIGSKWSWHPTMFALSNFSGDLSGASATGECLDRSAAPPSNVSATYTGELQSVNTDTGEVVYRVTVIPPGVTDGHSRNNMGLIGYQRVVANVTVVKNFGGWVEINKSSSNTAITDNNDCYSLEGAEYAVYDSSNNAVAKLTTDASGHAKSDKLPAGKYTIKELKAPKGYSLDTAAHDNIEVKSGQSTVVSLSDTPKNDPVDVLLGKFDGEKTYNGKDNLPLGSASLEGAEFVVKYYDGYYDTKDDAENNGDPTRTWVMKTDEDGYADLRNPDEYVISSTSDGKYKSDPVYTNSRNTPTFPLGTYVISEYKAPKGYNLPEPFGMDQTFVRQVTDDGAQGEDINTFNSPEVAEPISRSDLEFTKAASDDGHSLANVPFKITSKTTGESHVIVTDENGKASTKASWNKHTQDTNGNDWIMSENADGIQGFVANLLDSAKVLDSTSGVWFGQYKENGETKLTDPDDERGALPYDQYTLEELPCDANEGYQLIKKDFSITRDNAFNADYTVNLGTLTDQDLSISTKATDKSDSDQEIAAEPDVTITDQVSCDNLQKGAEYAVSGTLMNRDTGKPYVDASGNEVHGSTTFTANSQEQDVYVEFNFDGSNIDSDTELVVFEQIVDTTHPDRVIATHADINDQGQTVTVKRAAIGTTATDGVDGDKDAVKDPQMTVKDTVSYSGLTVGKEYTVKGELMDKATGTVLTDAAGKAVTAEKKFTPTASTGTVELEFTFDGSLLKEGDALVAFEHVLYKDKELATHADINDLDQTVTISTPKLGTTAASGQAGHEGDKNVVRDTTATIVDTVSYENAVPGAEYTVEGTLMNKETGNAVTNAAGQPIISSATFTSDSKNGTVNVAFTFDAADLNGASVVVFETLKRGNTVITEHKDLKDEDQTVKVITPEVHTTLQSSQAGHENSKDVVRDATATVKDSVAYKGLVIGKTYTVTGTLMNKETGEALKDTSGNPITASKEFTPDAANGTVELEFTFDSSILGGKKVVAFEKISQDGKEVGSHEDINDDDQTVTVVPPEVGTTLSSTQKGHEGDTDNVVLDTTATVKDSVAYKGLVIGKTYTVTGTLMNKETGEALKDTSGNPITASKEFTPDAANGTVELEFTFDSSILGGKKVVAFEKISQDGKEVGSHEDINDDDQTLTVKSPELETTAVSSENGHEGDKVVVRDTQATIKDTVKYNNVVVGKTYTVTGTLMDKETGEALTNEDGSKVTSETTFTANDTYGTVELEFTFDASALNGHDVVAFEKLNQDGKEVGSHEDIKDEGQTVKVVSPDLKTTAVDIVDSDKNVVRDPEASVVDTVEYKGLIPGKEYTMVAKIMDKSTGKAYIDPTTGNEITGSTTFTPDDTYGTVDVTLNFDASQLKQDDHLVVFESLKRDGKEVGDHSDIKDEDQMVTILVPEIHTTAADGLDNDKEVIADHKATVIDTVIYKDLVPGKEYTVTGTLMNKETNEALVDKDGNPVTASTTFTPDSPEGSVDVVFEFDSDLLAGKDLVAFEKLSRKGIEITSHEDINDDDQTVTVVPPKVGTTASDTADGDKHLAADPESSITDMIEYKNVVPGDEYTIAGILMDKSTGLPLLSGEGASEISQDQLQKFVDELKTASGVVSDNTVTIEVDGKAFGEGFEVTASDASYSYIDADGVQHVLSKADEGWKLTEVLGEVSTEIAAYTDDQVKVSENDATLPLVIDADAINKVMQDNSEIVSCLTMQEMTFEPKETSGTAMMEFPLNSIYNEDTDTVVFEFLVKNGEIIAQENDLSNEDQTVSIVTPKIGTTATDTTDGDHTLLPSRAASITDSVEYTDLIPGKSYTLSGTLMDKETGEPVQVGGGQVTAEKDFVPNQADGTVDIEFTFDAAELGGKDVVVYEKVYKDGVEIAKHEDINDEGQTVTISPVDDNTSENPEGDGYSKTGVDMAWLYGVIALIVALAGGAGAYGIRHRKLAKAAAEGNESSSAGDKE